MKPPLLILPLLMSIPSFSGAAEKQRDWQAGKVLDSQRSSYFAGSAGTVDLQ